jgi:hypothetical protein
VSDTYVAGPDVEGAVKDYLRQAAEVTATACGTRTFLAPDDPEFPYNRVWRIGGGEDTSNAPIDQALIQIDVFGQVRQLAEADTVRRGIRAALRRLQDEPFTAAGKARLLGAVVRDDRRLPDLEAQDGGVTGARPRYVITALVMGVHAPS